MDIARTLAQRMVKSKLKSPIGNDAAELSLADMIVYNATSHDYTIRYDRRRTRKLSIQLNLAHVARN